MSQTLSSKTKFIWWIVISVILVALAILIYLYQTGNLKISAAHDTGALPADSSDLKLKLVKSECIEVVNVPGKLQKNRLEATGLDDSQIKSYYLFFFARASATADYPARWRGMGWPIREGLPNNQTEYNQSANNDSNYQDYEYFVQALMNDGSIINSEKLTVTNLHCDDPNYTPPTSLPSPSPTSASTPTSTSDYTAVPTVEDTDGDGIPDTQDNDIDGDGISNVADPDIDGDGITNPDDPTPYGDDSNINQSQNISSNAQAQNSTSSTTSSPTTSPTSSSQSTSAIAKVQKLVSTGASLWFNILIAVAIIAVIGYFMFRDEIWKKK